MKLEVPFFKQTKSFNCGPTALRMVIAYLDKDPGIEILEQRSGAMEGKAISTIQLATAATSMGYPTQFFSKSIYFNEANADIDFYKNYSVMNLEISKKLVEEAEKIGVKIEERSVPLQELLSKVTENSLPITLVD